jgi:hypothetical protein
MQVGRWRELGGCSENAVGEIRSPPRQILALFSYNFLFQKPKSTYFPPFRLLRIEIHDDVGLVSCVEHGDVVPSSYTASHINGGPTGYTIERDDTCPACFSVVLDLSAA